MAIRLYNPDAGMFQVVDTGQLSQSNLLLNILIELRVHTMYLASQNINDVDDQPEQLRVDVTNDPSFMTVTPGNI